MIAARKLKILAGACASLALAAGTAGCTQTQSSYAPVSSAEAPAIEAPALWRIADEDTTIYVFGTVHALPDDIEWYSGPVKTALDASDTLVTEIDMTPEALAAIGAVVQEKAMLPEGTTVRSLLSDEQLATYEAKLTELGIPVNALDPLEPWMATLQLSQIAFAREGVTGENGTEKVLEALVGDSKGRDALETAAFQFEIFDELPQDVQIEYLMETLEEFDGLGASLQQMIDEWAVGDVQELGEMMNEALEADPVLADRLLYARNANWAVWIDERLDRPGTVFIAVGAGHLAGQDSVQDYLTGSGLTVTRVQ